MDKIGFVLTCLVCAGHGRRVHSAPLAESYEPSVADTDSNPKTIQDAHNHLQAFATLLQVLNPASAFALPSPGVPVSASHVISERSRPAVLGGHGSLDRRAVLAGTASLTAAAITGHSLPALADVRGANQGIPRDLEGINRLLAANGFPAMQEPNGVKALVQYIGFAAPANIDGQKSKERAFKSTLLVRFNYPSGWLVEYPSVDENGEGGNIAANDYQKGDSVTFAAVKLPADAKKFDDLKKPFYKGLITSFMTGDTFDDVKIRKVTPVKQDDGTEMALVDFDYTLNTRAGFDVGRRGIAGCQIIDNAVVGLVAATTVARWEILGKTLSYSANSFRAYPVKTPDFTLNELSR